MNRPVLVIKIGTSSITDSDGNLAESSIIGIADQIAQLHEQYRVLIVSSGAVGTGKQFLKRFSGKLIERKAAAAIGNPILVQEYARQFAKFDIPIAQSLCERAHFSDRNRFLRLRETYETLWRNQVIPVANENDVVSDLELRFSDNDELATLLAIGLNAEALLIATSVPGLMNADGIVVRRIETFDENILGMARSEKSDFGLGGMISKLTFAKLATRLGVRVIIFGLAQPSSILRALNGEIGTECPAKQKRLSARQRWLASGSLVAGSIDMDPGATASVLDRTSLLAVGVHQIHGSFEKGEVVELHDESGNRVALARCQVSSSRLRAGGSSRNMVVAHADEIILL